MAQKLKRRQRVKRKQPATSNEVKKLRKQIASFTPFRTVGGKVGSLFGPMGENIGKWLGSGVGAIFGSGDYTLSATPSYNVLAGSHQIPKFSTSGRNVVVSHREFIGDVKGSVAFTNTSYAINPGLRPSFPWLSDLADSFEQYIIHGLIYEFRTTSSDYNTSSPSLGSVIMACDYNASDPPFTTKQIMESTEFAVSCKPSVSMMFAVECSQQDKVLKSSYIRSGARTSEDKKFYDLGNFQIATVGMPSSYTIGELWVSYLVEFLKPTITSQPGGSTESYRTTRLGTTGDGMGSNAFITKGNLNVTFPSSDDLRIQSQPGSAYILNIFWAFDVAGAATYPFPVVNNGTWQQIFSTPNGNAPNNLAGVLTYSISLIAIPDATGLFSLTISSAPVPGAYTCSIAVSLLDSSAL